MKKVVLSVMILIAAASVSRAQGIRLGVKVGGNLNKISGQSFNDGFDFSYHAGGFLEIDFNKKWGIQPEVLFSQTSTKPSSFKTVYATAVNPALNGEDKVKLNYLSIPLLLRYNIGSILSLNAGPQYSILLNNNKNLLQNGQEAFKDGDFALVARRTAQFQDPAHLWPLQYWPAEHQRY
jgi:hypothetical protein